MHGLTHFVTNEVLRVGYPAVFVLMVLQAACIPVPSEATMSLGGALASASFVAVASNGAHHHLAFATVVAVGVLGDLVGSSIAYWVGRTGGRVAVERWGRRLFLREHELDRAEAWFGRHGEAAIIVAKLLPVVRSFISLPAGMAEVPFGRFLLYVAAGTLPFALAMAGLGYALGTKVLDYLGPVSLVVAILLVGAVAWWLLKRARERRATSG
jgi:membrane protein DedA with SNARE-associated domain